MKPIGLFGGTFDPVHCGHLALARGAFEALDLQSLILLPVGNPYQKGRLPLASRVARTDMLSLAVQDDPRIAIDDRELHRAGPTYTVDTLAELRAEFGAAQSFIWLIGSDAFSRLDTWHRWKTLFDLAHFAVVDRVGFALSAMPCTDVLKNEIGARSGAPEVTHHMAFGRVVTLGLHPPPISSTDIRLKIANGESVRGLTPDAVCDYIERHRLYLTLEKPNIG